MLVKQHSNTINHWCWWLFLILDVDLSPRFADC
jgi:hypothetical protein